MYNRNEDFETFLKSYDWDVKNEVFKNFINSEICNGITNNTVRFAEKFGDYLSRGAKNVPLTTSQLRRFFGEVKRQQMKGYDKRDFVMLKPKLAYAAGRAKKPDNGNPKIYIFYNVMVSAIDEVERCSKKDEAFKNFISFFEAIVAYHKAAEIK